MGTLTSRRTAISVLPRRLICVRISGELTVTPITSHTANAWRPRQIATCRYWPSAGGWKDRGGSHERHTNASNATITYGQRRTSRKTGYRLRHCTRTNGQRRTSRETDYRIRHCTRTDGQRRTSRETDCHLSHCTRTDGQRTSRETDCRL